ncbi:MAG: carboxypeptidase-like regulatory domain-containing protein [Chthoniobacterales bacterium]
MKTLLALPLLPLCLALFACVVSAETSPSPAAGKTGLEGVITISPTHGGPIREGEDSSKPLPNTAFIVRQGMEEVARFTTDAEGKYRVALPPGEYHVLARDQKHKFGGWGPFPVEVAADKMTTKNLDCDSGLR